jgi:hypothetical protein
LRKYLKAEALEERLGGIIDGFGESVGAHVLGLEVWPDVVERLARLLRRDDFSQPCNADG